MPKRTLPAITYRDPLDSFTDREEVLALFEQLLDSIQVGQFQLLAVKGNSGTGKTFLISYLTRLICPKLAWQSGLVSFARSIPDFRSILLGLEDAFKSCVPFDSFKQYRAKRDEYNRSFDNYRTAITIHQSVEANYFSSITGINQNVQVNVQLHERELQLRAELSRALVELSEESIHPLCLFIDGYERLLETSSELDGWLWEEVIPGLGKASARPLLIVTCGWKYPSNPTVKPFTWRIELTDFNRPQVKSYLEKQGVLTTTNPPSSKENKLVSAFYELTKGHPLVLAMSVAYFNELGSHQRTPESLRTDHPLIDEQARVEFLEGHLLQRLAEPYRTILEHGPVLRSFDQATLQALLSAGTEKLVTEERGLDDRTYDRFLHYPFIKQISRADNTSAQTQFTFHELVRRVGLSALRCHHPQTKEQLNHKMADYYKRLADTEQARASALIVPSSKNSNVKGSSEVDYTVWLTEIPEKELRARLEWLYHSLQVRELQITAFESWEELANRVVYKWQRPLAKPLFELIQQLEKEGEPFLSKTSRHYGYYLGWYSRFLEQKACWEEALTSAEHMKRIFEQLDDPIQLGISFTIIGNIYQHQSKHIYSLSNYAQALDLFTQEKDSIYIVNTINNIGEIYLNLGQLEEASRCFTAAILLFNQENDANVIASMLKVATQSIKSTADIYLRQGKMKQALSYYEKTLSLFEQLGDPIGIEANLSNIGVLYRKLGELEQAQDYHERALAIIEKVNLPTLIATNLINIGSVYFSQGKTEQALSYYQRALAQSKRLDDPGGIAAALNNIGGIYDSRGELEQALGYYQRALAQSKRLGDPDGIAAILNNIGKIYDSEGELDQALIYYEQTLVYDQQIGNLDDIASTFNNIGDICKRQGKSEQALSYFGQALDLREQLGNCDDIAYCLICIGDVYREQDELEEASGYYKRALILWRQVGNFNYVAVALDRIGSIFLNRRLDQALSYCMQAFILHKKLGDRNEMSKSRDNVSFILQKQADLEQKIELHNNRLSFYEQLGQGFEVEVVGELEELAKCYAQLGDRDVNLACRVRAKQIRRQMYEAT